MNKNYKVRGRQTMTDYHKTCTNVAIMDQNTGEIFMNIGMARVNPKCDEYDRSYGERLSFTRGYIGALKKARLAILPEYERVEREYAKLLKQVSELDRKIANSERYLECLLDVHNVNDDDDDDDENEIDTSDFDKIDMVDNDEDEDDEDDEDDESDDMEFDDSDDED